MNLAARPAAFALLLVSLVSTGRAQEPDAARLEKIEGALESTRGDLERLRAYSERGELSLVERARQRFNEAETQFLLENYEGCAALLQEAIDSPDFQREPSYPQALYYLAESLFQSQSVLESRRYFREAILRMKPGREFQNSIVRLIAISDRTGDFTGIDQYYESAAKGGEVRAEVKYLYAKWTANRRDLPGPDRLRRADEDFSKLRPGQPMYPQALYFRGAIAVQQGRLADAAQLFTQVRELPSPAKVDAKLKRVKELALLALARVSYELGKLQEAADFYAQLPRDTPEYNDAMFETAATYVKMGRLDQALRTAEILLLIGKESPVMPEAMILQANLLLRLEKFSRANEVFSELVQQYGGVRDQVRTTLMMSNDPVAYFDELLHQKEGALDVVSLLPPRAQPFVNTNREVAEARSIANELESGRKAVTESQQLAEQLLSQLATGSVNLFPSMQEGNSRASQLSTRLVDLEGQLVRLQVKLLGEDLAPEVKEKLAVLEAEREQLDLKFRNLPQTEAEYEERRAKFMKSIAELESRVSSLRLEIDFLRATLVANQLYWNATREERRITDVQDAEQQVVFRQDILAIEQLETWRDRIKKELVKERAGAAANAAGGRVEEQLRERYHQQLLDMESLIRGTLARLDPEQQALLARIGSARVRIESHQRELAELRSRLSMKAQERADLYRKRIQDEQRTLDDFSRNVQKVTGDTRHLLGQIAYDSFSRVGKLFYDIVLKSDVGLVDVAWGRKKGKSDQIAALAKDKDDEVKRLQDQFREVLTDAE